MGTVQIIAVLIGLAAALSYLNHRFLRLPMTIGLMLLSLAFALVWMLLEAAGLPAGYHIERLVLSMNFSQVLLEGMLGLLLFAGALHVNLGDLANKKLEISTFSTLGVLASTVMVGAAAYALSAWLDLGLGWLQCLLFGAIISPTDPIAVLGILKKAGAPLSLETKLAGESLFNDGIGVVVFLALLEMAVGSHSFSAGHLVWLFVSEALGGAVLGLALGYVAYLLLRSVNQYTVEILITLALAFGGYALAQALHLSGPIFAVVAGLLIGNHGRSLAMSSETVEHLDNFWELVDDILNTILFVLIGLEVMVLTLTGRYLLAGALAVPAALAARLISLGLPMAVFRRWRPMSPGALPIMTWGGLRGGISVALALSVPAGAGRELILTMTYLVVAFTILVQGLTLRPLVGKYSEPAA